MIHVGQELLVTRLETTVKTERGLPVLNGAQRFRYDLAAEDIDMVAGEFDLNY